MNEAHDDAFYEKLKATFQVEANEQKRAGHSSYSIRLQTRNKCLIEHKQ